MADTAVSNDSRRHELGTRAAGIAMLLLPISVFAVPLASNTVAESEFVSLTLVLGTILTVMLIAAALAVGLRSDLTLSPALLAGVALPLAMWASLLATPSGEGLILTVFATGALGLLLAMALPDKQGLASKVAAPLLLTSGIQGVLIIIQTMTDQPVGLTLFDADAELRIIDGLLRSPGTMHHVYEPAALALGAAGIGIVTAAGARGRLRWLWAGGAALAGSTIGLTHSRAALLGLLLMVPFLVLAARNTPATRPVILSLLIGFAIAAALTSSAWLLRGDQSITGDLDDMSLGRITLMQQAITMAADNPLVGVGPGRYLEVMRSDYELDPDYPFMVHNVGLAVAAENGIPAAIIVAALVGWAGFRALRRDPTHAALAVSISGFLAFDVLHYNRPVGLLLAALWLGTLHAVEEPGREGVTA